MGIDVVELVMRIEEEFDLKISDQQAGEMTSAKAIIEHLVSRREVQERNLTRDDIAKEVWYAIEEELSISREDYTEDSDFYRDMNAG